MLKTRARRRCPRMGLALSAAVLTGCTASGPSDPGGGPAASPSEGVGSPSDVPRVDWSGLPDRSTVAVQRIEQADLDRASWLPGYRLPRRMPEDLSGLPNLLDDLPGRAIASVYGEPNDINGTTAAPYPTPWARETVYFYGADGRWRVLRMEDLNLPDAGWGGSDNYSAGQLSPNGRWWGTKTLRGTIIMDLRSGELYRGPERMPGVGRVAAVEYRWTDDSRRVHITNLGLRKDTWASVPELDRLTRGVGIIYPFEGGYLATPDRRLGKWRKPPRVYRVFRNDGQLEREITVGANILGAPLVYRDAGYKVVEYGRLLGVSPTGESLGFDSMVDGTGTSSLNELTVVDAKDGSVTARVQFAGSVSLGMAPFDRNRWLVMPGDSGDDRRPYPGVRYVWDAETGAISKLTDLTMIGAEYRIYDLSFAQDLISADRPSTKAPAPVSPGRGAP